MEPQLKVLEGAEQQLSFLAREPIAHGLLVGIACPPPADIASASSSLLIAGALRAVEEDFSNLQNDAARLLDTVPEGFQAVGAFWTEPDGQMAKACSLLSATTSRQSITDTPAILACLGEGNGQPQYFLAPPMTQDRIANSEKKRVDVQAVDQSALWEAHVPLRCSLPVLLQIPTTSPAFPTPREIDTASEKVMQDLRSESAAFLVDSAKEPSCSVLVQPWDHEASVTGRGFASGGVSTSGKKGGGKGKKKAVVPEAQGEKNFDEMTCEELGGATEPSTHQKIPKPIRVTFLQRQSCSGDALRAPYLSSEPVASPTTLYPLPLSLDVLCIAPAAMHLTDAVRTLIVPALEKQLQHAVQLAQDHKRGVVAHLFHPPGVLFPVTALYPHSRDEGEQLLVGIRTHLHRQLGLPLDRPLLRSANALLSADAEPGSAEASTSGRLLDVHAGIRPSGIANGKLSLIHGSYEYYHYMQDRIDDKGWGCAYRSLQTIVSWFRLQNYTTVPVPSHRTIQQTLVDLQDKEASFVGSSQWIGAIELGYILDALLGVTCKVLNVSSGADLPSKARELAHHFDTQGTPVMIGGGVLAYTLLGIDYNELTGECAFLILDPHYTGGESLKAIQSGQWIGWKRGGANGIFVQNAFYNLLLPQRPQIV
ncbi:hypothetical protein KFL_000170350 [Klebsormidium nitens]|uniref:Probable Ufm1-specific protease n=1 Tax=Klebsormidium nitens TaxID=105231 RepID=A0A1Y1HND1_KLENI|nr:hypothetical protein KFL_000170350 [Klebsormidium nitens]|eukprot:GAQ78689.1 hypothetical protein KFL_000170350 [Klebsormidium nitens]